MHSRPYEFQPGRRPVPLTLVGGLNLEHHPRVQSRIGLVIAGGARRLDDDFRIDQQAGPDECTAGDINLGTAGF